ncbi:MAG: hypothetical protein ABI689_02300 [Thermoanaerobaculia bacterium]
MNRREREAAAARWARSVLDKVATGAPGDCAPESWPAAWAALELPAAPPVPVGFARRVAGAWATEQVAAAAPILGAAWMRAAALAALLAGIALGSTLSYGSGATDASGESADSWQPTSLSEEYLSALASPETILASPAGANDSPGVAAEEPPVSEP